MDFFQAKKIITFNLQNFFEFVQIVRIPPIIALWFFSQPQNRRCYLMSYQKLYIVSSRPVIATAGLHKGQHIFIIPIITSLKINFSRLNSFNSSISLESSTNCKFFSTNSIESLNLSSLMKEFEFLSSSIWLKINVEFSNDL